MIAKHVLEVSVNCKLESQCVRFKKKHCFALVVLNQFPICFIKPCSHDGTCIIGFFCTIMLSYYAGKKDMIHEPVNLKGVVYEPKQNTFGLQKKK